MNDSLSAVMIVPTSARCKNELVVSDSQADYTVTIRCEDLLTNNNHGDATHHAKIDRVELFWRFAE